MKKRLSANKRIRITLCALAVMASMTLMGCDYGVLQYFMDNIDQINSGEEAISEAASNEEIIVPTPTPTPTPTPEAIEEPVKEPSEEQNEESNENVVDLVFFMGQSNMAGTGGNAAYAPKVDEGKGYEFRAISDPTKLYPITEPFGINENNLNAIMDLPGAKKGSLVSSFINTYYDLTETPVVAVSASAGATDTDFWMSDAVVNDYNERIKRAMVWLESSGYEIRHKYVVWLQGESDAIDNTSSEEYETNMDTIIRPMFIEGIEKVFFITPGRTITRKNFFNNIIAAQLKMSRESGYYALGTTLLSAISTEYLVDEWHYNQTVLNLIGKECAQSVAYYTINGKECCLYDYKNDTVIVPEGWDGEGETVEPLDLSQCGLETELD